MTMQRQVSLGEAAAKLSEHFARAGEETTAPERELILGAKRMLRLLAAPLVEQMGLVKNGHGMAEEDKEEGEEEEEEGEPVELLDSACGTGVVTQEVQATHSAGRRARSRFVCADASAAMVELVRKRAAAEGWANVEARVADARDTKLPGASFTHAAVALGLHLITRPDAVVGECWRVLRAGGVFGATTFPRSNGRLFWYPDLRGALAGLPFAAPALPERMPMQMHTDGRWDDAEWIAAHVSGLEYGGDAPGATARWQDVRVRQTAGVFRVEGADEWMAVFGSMLAFLLRTYWDEDTRARHPLDKVRELVRRHLEDKHGGRGWDVEFEVLTVTAVKPRE